MRSRMNHTVSAWQVHDLAGGILRRCLQWADRGRKCTVHNLLLVLFFAASRASSIHDACRRLRNAPSDQTVYNALVMQLPKMPELERQLNLGLADKLPKGLFRKARVLAADTTPISYYGKPWKQERELCRGKRKAGTTRFHCYATLYVVHHGQRFTVAMTYVWKKDSNAQVLQRLLEQAKRIGLRVRYLLLDRGFYGLDVVQHLQSIRCPFLMPVVHRGRKPKRTRPDQLRGTRRFLAWKKSGWSTHVMRNNKRQATVKICVACLPPRTGRRRKRSRRPLVFAFWGFRPGSPASVRQEYRKRFGIESSYRQMNQGRIRTCSRNPRVRMFLAALALILRNVWVWLHGSVLGQVRGRGMQLRLELLRLRTMLLMLQRCAEEWLGCSEMTQPSVGPGFEASSFL